MSKNESGEAPQRRVKITLVGSPCKQTGFTYFSTGRLPPEYMPALIENYVHVLNVDGAEYELALWDTVSQQEFERWRSSRHPDTDVVLIHFEINDPDSFDNVSDKWAMGIRRFLREVPFVLVGYNPELRIDRQTVETLKLYGQHPVTTEEAEVMRNEICAARYVECSTITGEWCEDVLKAAIIAFLEHEKEHGMNKQGSVKGWLKRLFRQ